jgi:hypothetical protein
VEGFGVFYDSIDKTLKAKAEVIPKSKKSRTWDLQVKWMWAISRVTS